MSKIQDRNIVVVNQAVNYLTVDICNAFANRFVKVDLITGNVHEQERELNPAIAITYINRWVSSPFKKKLLSNIKASIKIYWLLKTKYKNHEVFFVSAPSMGYLINLLVQNKFSILIWDVFPDALKVSGIKETNLIYRCWAYLNKKSFNKAFRLYTISDKMGDLLSQYIPIEKQLITPIWSIFQSNKKIKKENNIFIKQHQLQDKFIVQYSGNIGLSHRVEFMIELADLLIEQGHIHFQIIGRGPRVKHLKHMVKIRKLTNCQFLPFQSDELFPNSLSAADLGVVILDETSSKGSVPSKSYNLMSFGIPSLYIASKESELYEYCKKYKHGKCFSEEEIDQVVNFIKDLSLDITKQEKYKKNALHAAKDFKLSNADRIVNFYLKNTEV